MGGELEKSLTFGADPAGVFHTSSDPELAKLQAKMDPMGYGAKAEVATREAEKKQAAEIAKAKEAAEKEQRLVEAQEGIEAERQRRLQARRARRIERGSLLYGMEEVGKDTLGG